MVIARAWAERSLVWDRRTRLLYLWPPYVLLALALTISLLIGHSAAHNRYMLLLVGIALVWLLGMFSLRSHRWRTSTPAMTVFVAGELFVAALLTLHDGMFFVFAVIGFFHAFLTRRVPLAVLALAITSVIVNLMPDGFRNPFADGSYPIYLLIMLIQVTAISFGTLSTLKTEQESEQRRQAVLRLEEALAENARLQEQLLTRARESAVDEERKRMAREIHDTLAQGLTGIVTQLQAAKRSRADDGEWERHVDTAAELARESLSEARRSVLAVRPEILETDRLEGALSDVAGRWSQINGIPADVVTTGSARPMHPEVEVTLLRTTQEALANVAKHARASRVGLTLSYMEDLVRLDVRDDGVGFDVSEKDGAPSTEGGFGLVAMRERVGKLSGRLEIESEPGAGTAVSASVPAIQPGGAA